MSGSRNISAGLQASIASRAASLTVLLKIVPASAIYSALCVTKLDRDYAYDDGAGLLTYSALVGVTPAAMQASSAMTVGNSEAKSLVAASTAATLDAKDVRAGAYDNAEYTFMVIDFEHPEYGHWIPPNGHGVVGQQTIDERGLSVTFELTDLTKLLKQSVVENWSRQCRAIFGSQPIGTGGGVVEQKHPCGKSLTSMWTGSRSVSAPGAESDRAFTCSGLSMPAGTYVPGMLEWLTGDNAGRSEMVEAQSGLGVITLKFPMAYPIKTGDTFTIRPDCTRTPDGTNGCKFHFASVSTVEWKQHYRGEWQTPVADGDSLSTPGASA
ncbi:MAG: DUF2163 domain-containing protein [Proteobacteria bacterium]|nr:DUF2163 domain-containing protein [Pseudomonadota bacterium]